MSGKKRRGRPASGRALSAAERMRRYRTRRKAAGLKPVIAWVARQPIATPYSRHRLIEARSLALHCVAAQKVERKSALLGEARRTLGRWLRRYPDRPPRALLEWSRLLSKPWPDIARLITGTSEESARLRQSSPFATLLSPAERRRVYAAFRA